VVWGSGTFGFRGPAYRILEKQNQRMINVRIQKKLDHLQAVLLFKDSSDFSTLVPTFSAIRSPEIGF
jgi:hypothetical protein